ncbi:hypothetical protein SAMN04488063_0153 [Halopelagius inordinatus]|uniref:Uncharacterized protein n=1 Tax=Halopelagius inordinatus TaxID=553467 RepID=A0A1I2L9I3_9EURY|nr:hypothetical protein [Halopelagius inordinatus]SFF75643.1 hypothetical protein SAMN04488063_0153 [Halopelagius inordinatus]
MAHEELKAASDDLRAAAEDASGELQSRIYDQSNQLADLAAADRGPDHGRLARHMNALTEIADAADGTVRERVESAYDHVEEYRSGVSGV